MRVLVVHAHPVETSFNRALFTAAVDALQANGHEVDAMNLYDEGFDAVMSRDERLNYHDVPGNLTPLTRPYVDRVRAAEGVVFVHPVWNYGYPAILKGFFDRIFLPGVSFVLVGGEGNDKGKLVLVVPAAYSAMHGERLTRRFETLGSLLEKATEIRVKG